MFSCILQEQFLYLDYFLVSTDLEYLCGKNTARLKCLGLIHFVQWIFWNTFSSNSTRYCNVSVLWFKTTHVIFGQLGRTLNTKYIFSVPHRWTIFSQVKWIALILFWSPITSFNLWSCMYFVFGLFTLRPHSVALVSWYFIGVSSTE